MHSFRLKHRDFVKDILILHDWLLFDFAFGNRGLSGGAKSVFEYGIGKTAMTIYRSGIRMVYLAVLIE